MIAAFEMGWGQGMVVVSEGRLVAVDLHPPVGPRGHRAVAGGMAPEPAGVATEDQEVLDRWVRELEAYFRGERLGWSAEEVPLGRLEVPSFDRSVYEALLSVPAACTISYGALAELAGYPRAARAVGNAMANNPIPIVVPCHRVIYSDGRLGHYGSDDGWKERLLAHEERCAALAGRGAAPADPGNAGEGS